MYGSGKLLSFSSLLFRYMLSYSCNIKELTLSTILSISTESKGSLSDINNYRVLINYIIIEISDSTSDTRFASKNNISTTMYISIYG